MSVTTRSFKVKSSDGVHELSGIIYIPDGKVRGFFHIVHGMTEYIGRYDRIMSVLANEGWICFGYDHLGHGHTAKDRSELGFIAKKKGWDLLCRDVKEFSSAVKAEFSEYKELPYVLMGHSMGSFIARLAAERYVTPDKLIIMGTGGSNPAADAGLILIAIIKKLYGDKHISKLIYKLAFGGYNKRFTEPRDLLPEAPQPWLTNDVDVRKKYSQDEFCNFLFTTSAMGDLIRLMKYANSPSWYKNIRTDMPILLVSGSDDPVGNFSKGVNEVYRKLQKRGAHVKCKLYPKARHEILNDISYEDVKKDILDFCK